MTGPDVVSAAQTNGSLFVGRVTQPAYRQVQTSAVLAVLAAAAAVFAYHIIRTGLRQTQP